MIIVFLILYNNMNSILYSTSRTGVFLLMSMGSAFQSLGALAANDLSPIKLSFSLRYSKKHLSWLKINIETEKNADLQ